MCKKGKKERKKRTENKRDDGAFLCMSNYYLLAQFSRVWLLRKISFFGELEGWR